MNSRDPRLASTVSVLASRLSVVFFPLAPLLPQAGSSSAFPNRACDLHCGRPGQTENKLTVYTRSLGQVGTSSVRDPPVQDHSLAVVDPVVRLLAEELIAREAGAEPGLHVLFPELRQHPCWWPTLARPRADFQEHTSRVRRPHNVPQLLQETINPSLLVAGVGPTSSRISRTHLPFQKHPTSNQNMPRCVEMLLSWCLVFCHLGF